MDIDQTIMKFKERRNDFPKKNMTLSLTSKRFDALQTSVMNKAPTFIFLNKSERFEFMLYLLELCLENNAAMPHVPVQKIELNPEHLAAN